MSNNIYSDQVNNSNLYANKLFYGEEGEQVENLGDQVAGEEDDKSEEDLLRDCRDEIKKAKDKLIQCKKDAVESQREITRLEAETSELKSQVQEEREKVEQTKNEAKAEVDKLKLQVQEEREKVEQTKNEAEAAKEEVLRYKIEQEKEEVMQSKIEGVKEELLKCKINMAKAETEWYKKAAEECKNEKRIGTDKPSIKVGNENDRGKHVTNEGGNENDRGKHVTNEGGNESGEITSREITPDLSLPGICGPKATLYKSNNKIGCQGFNTSDLLKGIRSEVWFKKQQLAGFEKGLIPFVSKSDTTKLSAQEIYSLALTVQNMNSYDRQHNAVSVAQHGYSLMEYSLGHPKMSTSLTRIL